jgi:hypothetical protein
MKVKNNLLKKACVVAAVSMLPLSQAAFAGEEGVDWGISGWINEGVQFYDDGQASDVVQISDNGTTLGNRITLSGSADLPGTNGWTAGFEVIIEPNQTANTPLLFSNQDGAGSFDNATGHAIGILGDSVNVAGAWGKVTVGLQSMPTDNIAVLEDPSLTLWASISPVFRGNGFTIRGLGAGAANTTWGSFLQCYTVPGLGIGIDCNGIYRNGVRYDLPAFGPVTIAIGYANDDVYDVAAKWKGNLGRINAQLALGYAINQGGGGSNVGGSESENFQAQGGLMDPETGLFASIAYNNDNADGPGIAATSSDDMDAYWLKAGIKKAWFAPGDTSLAFQWGDYSDAYGTGSAGVTGSSVERLGFEDNQYFGSKLIIYGVWENLDLSVDCTAGTTCAADYSGASDLDTFTLGLTYFF